MRMEFRRMTGVLILERAWPAHGRPVEEIAAEAKDALASCYEGDKFSFWPKKEFASNAPEEVRVVDGEGRVIAQYDLCAFLAETQRSMIARRNA
jgi:hypothetical protein